MKGISIEILNFTLIYSDEDALTGASFSGTNFYSYEYDSENDIFILSSNNNNNPNVV